MSAPKLRKFLRDEFAQLFGSNEFLIEQADGETCLRRRILKRCCGVAARVGPASDGARRGGEEMW